MKLLYFAWVRERVGKAEEHVDPPAGVKTVGYCADIASGVIWFTYPVAASPLKAIMAVVASNTRTDLSRSLAGADII